jgi:vacuolar protein sorting-associated protein 41
LKDGEGENDTRPHVRVIDVHPDSFEEISLDAVTIKDYQKNKPCDYRLDFIKEENSFFIIAPKDIIKATPRSFDDHIKWLIDRNKYEQALDDIKATNPSLIKTYSYELVVIQYIDYLLQTKQYREAADWCSKTSMDAKSWEEKILFFAIEGQLEEIYEKIPHSNPKLSAVIYEKVLNEFLKFQNYQIFKYLIKKWPCDIYDLNFLTTAVLDAQNKNKNRTLLESIAILYEYQKLYNKSFVIYINLADQTVFDFLVKHDLYDCALDNIIALIDLNKDKAIDLFVKDIEKFPVKLVANKLASNKHYLHYYLDAMFNENPSASRDFHTMQVVLYAEYERSKLLKFLQNSQYIILAQAQKELQERNLIPEIVYILERMGQIKKAFQLVLHAIKDVNQAIDFCKKHNDKDLWEDLINFSLNKAGKMDDFNSLFIHFKV